jgi:hypothetical protein
MENMYQLVYQNISTGFAQFHPKYTCDSHRMLHKIWRTSSHNGGQFLSNLIFIYETIFVEVLRRHLHYDTVMCNKL